jgi:2-polyprenyl-3-methyl-5-hydroxy-6-metoxy-1,4-benzoquinol methylase
MSIRKFYEDYWSARHPPPTTDPLTGLRMEALWREVGARGAGRRLLDCGSGEGHLVAEAAQRGYEGVGLEIADAAVQRARTAHPGLEFILHSVEDRPWPVEEKSVDVVVSFEVIEHLLMPRQLVVGASEALKTGGSFVLSTPYHGLIKNLALSLLAFDSHFDVDGPHIRFFSDKALTKMLTESGFVAEKILHLGRFWRVWENSVVVARKT